MKSSEAFSPTHLPLTIFVAVVLIVVSGGIGGFTLGVSVGQQMAQRAQSVTVAPSPTVLPSPTSEPPSPTEPQPTATGGLRTKLTPSQ